MPTSLGIVYGKYISVAISGVAVIDATGTERYVSPGFIFLVGKMCTHCDM